MRCYCCSNLPFSSCCEPFLKGQATPQTAALLMRSRFSAYASKQFDYVLATYTKVRQPELSVDELTANAANATWFALEVGETENVSLIVQDEGGLRSQRKLMKGRRILSISPLIILKTKIFISYMKLQILLLKMVSGATMTVCFMMIAAK